MSPHDAPRILLIDDDTDLRRIGKEVLERAGYEVDDLPSAHGADERIAAFDPDALVCDVLMPGESGLSLCRRLRDQAATAEIPIVLVSARSGASDRRAARDAGADRYLVKPVKRTTLLETLEEVLQTGLRIEVFGCRGSLPQVPDPGARASRFGGHTTCLRVHVGRRSEVVVLDAGTGLRPLGRKLHSDAPIDAHILLSHYHIDHIYGLPFFKPLFGNGSRVTIHGGVEYPGTDDPLAAATEQLESTISGAFNRTYWPVSMADVPATVLYRPFYDERDTCIEIAGLEIEVMKVDHGDITYGYKLTQVDAPTPASVVFIPDNHISPSRLSAKRSGALEARLVEFVQGADLVIHDCMYPQAKYERHMDYGHTGAKTLARFCALAHVPEVLLFHHDIDASDDEVEGVLQEFETESRAVESQTRAQLAVEGQIVGVGR